MEDDRDIVSITLSSNKDKGPLQYVSGEELTRLHEIVEAADALVAAENRLRAALAKRRSK
jgi:hypothetical protein